MLQPSDTPISSQGQGGDPLPLSSLSSSAIGGIAGGGVFLFILSIVALLVISAVCVSVKRKGLSVHACVHACAFVCVHERVRVCMHAHLHVCVHVFMFVCLCMHVCAYVSV